MLILFDHATPGGIARFLPGVFGPIESCHVLATLLVPWLGVGVPRKGTEQFDVKLRLPVCILLHVSRIGRQAVPVPWMTDFRGRSAGRPDTGWKPNLHCESPAMVRS
jgi:hypothetical protein